MESDSPLPGQQPATCPYPETVLSSLRPNNIFLKIHFNIILISTPTPFRCPHHNPVLISLFRNFLIRGDRFVAGRDCTGHQ
jgi:hypothetical protein